MESEFSLTQAFKLIFSKIKSILVVALLAGGLMALVSLILPNYYLAGTSFYAASPELALPAPLTSDEDYNQIYGNDYDIDRLIAISESQDLFNHLIDSFDLYNHYNINPNKNKAKHLVREEFASHYEVLKTKYNAIHLTVEDQSPEKAAQLANAARERISQLAQNLVKRSQKQTLQTYLKNINDKTRILTLLSDSVRIQKDKYKIIDLSAQAEVLAKNQTEVGLEVKEKEGKISKMEQLGLPRDSINQVRAVLAGLDKKQAELESTVEKFNDGLATIRTLEIQISILNSQVGLIKERYNQLSATYASPFTALHVIEEAEVPIVKHRPRRSLLVLGVTMMSGILMALFFLFKEVYTSGE